MDATAATLGIVSRRAVALLRARKWEGSSTGSTFFLGKRENERERKSNDESPYARAFEVARHTHEQHTHRDAERKGVVT